MITKSKKWKQKEMANFLIRIGQFMQRGYSLSSSLELYALNERKEIQADIEQILERLKNGDPFHEILTEFHFPNDVIASLYFFEHYNLAEGLIHSGTLLEKRLHFKERLQKILQYPLFLTWLTSVMIYMLFRYLIPQFSRLYDSVGSGLPKASQVIISSVTSLPLIIIIFVALFLLTMFLYFMHIRTKSPRAKLITLLRLPFINTLTRLLITQRFSLNLSSLLQAGISINKAFQIFERQNHSPFFQQEAIDIKFRLLSGESLEQIMQNRKLYQQELTAVIKHGQMNGMLSDELALYAEMLLRKLEELIVKMLNIIQPVIFTAVGIIVLLMFLAIMLPMIQFIQTL